MKLTGLLSSVLIGAVASARSMTPMASIAAARLLGYRTPGHLALIDRPLFRYGALAMGAGELAGDKMKSAPDRTVLLGLTARVMSAGIAGAALAPRGREQAGAALAVAAAVPLAYLTLAGRKRAMAEIGQTRSGWIEDALVIAAGVAVVALTVSRED
ncbi:putative membrane protein [Burkholderiales bacterium 8X]|nr:putative membrane protein [Burkholderiales bacterium 8X]